MTLREILQTIIGNKWLYSLILIGVFYLGAKLLTWIIENIVHFFTKRTKTKVDDLIIEKTKKWAVALFFFIAVRAFIVPLFNGGVIEKINNSMIIFLVTMIAIIIVGILIDVWGKIWSAKTKSTLDDTLLPLFRKLADVIIGIIGFIIILNHWGISVTPFLAGAGVIGIILGFALKDSLANIFGGIALILDKNFQLEDVIKLNSGETGTIIDIGLRSTKIKTFDNELLVIPNANLAITTIQNFAKPDLSVRVIVEFGVVYGSDIEKVRKIVLDVLKKVNGVLKEPEPKVYFNTMGDFSLQFKLFFWVDSYTKRVDAKEEATEAVYNALNKTKIGIPFPTSTVYLKKK